MVRQGLISQTPSGLVCLGHHETSVMRTYCLMPSPTQHMGNYGRSSIVVWWQVVATSPQKHIAS